jgi:outer membrane protein with beta-barrel domain
MRKLLLVAGLALGGNVAQADNGSFYFGAGVTSNQLKDIVVQGNVFPDLDNTSWKVFAGFRPISVFAIEADYLDFGSNTAEGPCTDCCMAACRGLFQSDAQAFAVYALGFLPIPVPFLDIYGKAGLARSKLNTNVSGSGTSNRGTEFAWGVGIQAHISMVGARLEYEDLKIPNSSGAKVASLSVFVSFL